MSKNVLVVGMPRSGTSMTAAIFSRSGYFVTNDDSSQLRSKDEFNPSGYWEAEHLIKHNADIFSAAGYAHDNTWLYDPINDKQASKILELDPTPDHQTFVDEYNEHSPWIWKDPRLCYTLGYWWPLMDNNNTRVLLLQREPDEIYQSFLRLKWRTPNDEEKADTYKRIKEHIKAAEIAIKKYNIPHLRVSYSDYVNNAESTANRISEFFEIDREQVTLDYNKKLNTSGFSGKMIRIIDKAGDMLPDKSRKRLKNLIPRSILRKIFPHRSI